MPAAPVTRPPELLTRLGADLLAALDALTATLVATIVASDPTYEQMTPAALADVKASCHDNLGRILQVLSGSLPADAEPFDAPHATGTRRAEQGVPLEAVLHAYRLGGRVIWEAMASAARASGATAVDALVEAATSVWEIVDTFSSEVADAYRRHEFELTRRSDERRHVVLDALLEGRAGDATVSREAERVLDLRPGMSFAVVVTRAGEQSTRWLRAATGALDRRGIHSAWRPRADGAVGLVVLDRLDATDLAGLLHAGCAGVEQATGVSPRLTGLATAGEANRLARAALDSLPEGDERVVTLEQRLVPALLGQDGELADRLAQAVLGPVLALPGTERELLLETLAAWLEHGGSTSRIGAALYCHRNTVLNRLRRLETLTGRSVERPHDLVELVLALTRVTLTGAGGHRR